jgi:hypothetical protein
MHFPTPRDGPEKVRSCEAEARQSIHRDTLRADNEADEPFPTHPSGGTESAHLSRRQRSKGRLDPAVALASSIWADSVPSRDMGKCITRSRSSEIQTMPRRMRLKDELLLALLPTATVLLTLALVEHFGWRHLLCAALASNAFLIYLDPEHEMNAVRTNSPAWTNWAGSKSE